ncbi:GNAT family N-acetyltransferase [Streptomyces hundungensis]|uniref:GNAT family N-acetyltransferase n=1 Tax=Streptomyces hundungensis TaxID=1077946 RepID=UPI0031E88600
MTFSREAELHFRLATEADLAFLVRLRDDAARWMLAQKILGQWQPGELDEHHFRDVMASGEVWLAEAADRPVGAWELWWADEDAWGTQPPEAGYVHRLMVDRSHAPPGTGRLLLQAAERRVAAAGRAWVRLDCLAGNARLTGYYLDAGYQVVGRKEGKPQPGGVPKSFTLLEKAVPAPDVARASDSSVVAVDGASHIRRGGDPRRPHADPARVPGDAAR